MILNIKYRKDIDSIRAIAVLSVLLFHFDVKGFDGGFLGVDIFFVISGFLITKLIITEISDSASFDFKRFYFRRIKRLAPALVATLVWSFFVGFILLTPEHFQSFSGSLISAIFSVSNFFFYSGSGYFDTDSSLKPLLHTWSLSVEEQFYLIYPFLMFALLVNRPKKLGPIFIVGVGVFSLCLNFIFAGKESLVFYLMPFRVFQFSLGAIVVWLLQRQLRDSIIKTVLLISGLFIIACTINMYEKGVEPTFYPLFVSIGTAFLIYSGSAAKYGEFWRANPILSWFGLRSYSLYLIHWPIVVFYKYYVITDSLTSSEAIVVFVITTFLAAVSYKYIEQPFRNGVQSIVKPVIKLSIRVALLVLVAIVLASSHAYSDKWGNGWEWRMPEVISKEARLVEKNYRSSMSDVCSIDEFISENCDLNKANRIMVMGDSHVNTWMFAFSNVFKADNVQFFMFSYLKCHNDFVIIDDKVTSDEPMNNCDKKAKFLSKNKKFLSTIDSIILASYRPYSYGANPWRFDLIQYIRRLNPEIKIYILGNYFQTGAKQLCSMIVMRRGSLESCLDDDFIDYVGTYDQVKTERLYSGMNSRGYIYIDYKTLLCERKDDCIREANGFPIMMDNNHPSYTFSKLVLETIKERHPIFFKKIGLLN